MNISSSERTAGDALQQAMKRKRGDILLKQGMSLAQVSGQLHHADKNVTRRHYVDEQAGQVAEQATIRKELRVVRGGKADAA